MCTAGWYPILVAPLATIGLLLATYSSAGCQLMNIDIGFTPSNVAWNHSSTADIGLFFYYDQSNASVEQNKYKEIFHNGCTWYTDDFDESFISKDRTWKVARVMALISISGSIVVVFATWMTIFFPLPVCCIWSGIILPCSMLGFIAEGSKFLIFDIALCRNAVWFPSGIDSLPAEAETCSMGESSYYGIAAGVVNLISLLAICLRSPDKRRLDPDYGITSEKVVATRQMVMERDNDSRQGAFDDDDDEGPSVMDDEMYTSGPSPSNIMHMSQDGNNVLLRDESSSMGLYENFMSSHNKQHAQHCDINVTSNNSVGTRSTIPDSGSSVSGNMRISESRLCVMSKMQLHNSTDSDDMIDKLVSDLDSSLQGSPAHSHH
jgi:hypothetical protein